MKEISLVFEGYTANGNDAPYAQGIYLVYRGTNFIYQNPKQLLYIGEAENVFNRLWSHEKQREWQGYLQHGEELLYSFARTWSEMERKMAEAALIYRHEPPVNIEYKWNYPFSPVAVRASGAIDFIQPVTVVQRSLGAALNPWSVLRG